MNPIVILHGALGSANQLDPVKVAFEANGLSVHCLNFSGHGGKSFQTKFGIEQFAQDVLHYLDIHEPEQVNIFGYSMGGYVALWLAKEHPNRVGKIVTLGTKFDWSVESASKEVEKLNAEKILEKVPAFARILEHRHTPNNWKELLQKTSDMMLALGEKPLLTEAVVRTIDHQTLILLGDQDDMADRNYSEQVASFLTNGVFQLLENTPHPIEKVDLKKIVDLCIAEW
ncbi:MAG: alpha/beta hydrolase [Cyclobacteriaceae bacterium]